MLSKIQIGIFDEEVATFLSEPSNKQVCQMIVTMNQGFRSILITYMEQNDTRATNIILEIENGFHDACKRWEGFDPIANFADDVLSNIIFPFVVKEVAARILRDVAKNANRFHAQRLIKN